VALESGAVEALMQMVLRSSIAQFHEISPRRRNAGL